MTEPTRGELIFYESPEGVRLRRWRMRLRIASATGIRSRCSRSHSS